MGDALGMPLEFGPVRPADRLVREIDALLAQPGRLEEMADAALTVGRPDAAERVADLLVRHARRPMPVDPPPGGGELTS
mgnify:CR=1 FL=1